MMNLRQIVIYICLGFLITQLSACARTNIDDPLSSTDTQAVTPDLVSTYVQQTVSAMQSVVTLDVTAVYAQQTKAVGTQSVDVDATPSAENGANDSQPCYGNRWSIVPLGLYTSQPKGGFKHILIPIAIENNSPYWGTLGIPSYKYFVTTEGGFRYESSNPGFSSRNELTYTGGKKNFLDVGGYRIPPGFSIHGTWRGTFQLIFEVAEAQNSFVVEIPYVGIACTYYDSVTNELVSANEPLGAVFLNLATDIRDVTYPTSRPDSDFLSIADPIEIAGTGTFYFQNITDGEVKFEFTNASGGYETSGYMGSEYGYLIGSDGIIHIHKEFGGRYYAGPGQTTEVSINIEAITDLKLIWFDSPYDPEKKIYDFPDPY